MSSSNSPPSSETITAAQRALGIAEIVGLIASFVPPAYVFVGKDLVSCTLVNKFWYDEIVPMLWRNFFAYKRLDEVFLSLKPARRQFFANLILSANSSVLDDSWRGGKDLWASGGPLHGVVFPKMNSLHMLAGAHESGELSLPSIDCPNLRSMSFAGVDEDSESEVGMDADGWESIFWDLPTKFPSLQKLVFAYPPHVFPHAIRRLKKRHPNLRVFLGKLKFHEIFHFDQPIFGGGFEYEPDYDGFESNELDSSDVDDDIDDASYEDD